MKLDVFFLAIFTKYVNITSFYILSVVVSALLCLMGPLILEKYVKDQGRFCFLNEISCRFIRSFCFLNRISCRFIIG